jgi:hypothetical protein
VAWGAGVGLALLLVSLAYAGPGTYETYLTETVPALSKGSTHYSNAGFGAVIARAHTPSFYRGLPEMIYLDEVSSNTAAHIASYAVILAGLAAIVVVARRRPASVPASREVAGVLPGYYFVVAVGLLISSVTWEFYVIWLLPAFLAVFLAPERVLPSGPLRWWLLVTFAVAYVALNYPGDAYLFTPNAVFYHPDWVPGIVASKILPLYDRRPDLVLWLRLPGLLLTAGTLAWLSLHGPTDETQT